MLEKNIPIIVKQITNKKNINDFINYPYELYKKDLNWIPPLRIERQDFFNPKKNPYFEHAEVVYFLAYKENKIVGRVTAHEDQVWNKHYQTRQGFFGFYESENDTEVATALMQAVEDWCKNREITNILGPMDFSTNHEIGFLTEGFDSPPVLLLKYTKPYYLQLLNQLGYVHARGLLSYECTEELSITEKFKKISERAKKFAGDSFKIRNINLKKLRQELNPILDIYNEAWSENWGFIPMSPGEIDLMANQFRLFSDPRFIFIIEKQEEMVGFLISLPDINQALLKIRNGKLFPFGFLKLLWNFRKINRGSVILLGVKKEFRNKGLELILFEKTILEGTKPPQKYHTIQTTWILDSNKPMNSIMEFLQANIVRRYTVMSKDM